MNFREHGPRREPLTAIEQALEALHVADEAGRSKLPTPPPGYEWHADLDIGEGAGGGLTARLIYSLRPRLG